jgi:N-acetyl-anhydromuramyl-L-alanine amidase AmpD
MAIIDHSRGTEFIARSLTRGGGESIRKQITGGMLPEETKEEIVSLIKTRVEENDGVVPNELYTEVANLIYPYAAIPVTTLETILAATNFFGLTGKQPNAGNVGYKGATEKLVAQLEESRSRMAKSMTPPGQTAAAFSPIEVGDDPGSAIENAARTMSGAGEDDTIEIVTPKQPMTRTPPLQLGKNNTDETQDIDPGSNYVSSAEELEAEMVTITREVTEIIVHFSETYTNANLNKDTVPGGNKYHYIVRRDGSIQRSLPLNAAGKHCPENGHNAYSIGVCLVGGLSAASGEEVVGPEVDPSAISRSQYNAMYHIFDAFFRVWPGGQALGHSEINPEMQDPGFDVRDYVFAKFKKISLYENPETDAALSKDDILERQAGNSGVPILTKDPDVEEKYQ